MVEQNMDWEYSSQMLIQVHWVIFKEFLLVIKSYLSMELIFFISHMKMLFIFSEFNFIDDKWTKYHNQNIWWPILNRRILNEIFFIFSSIQMRKTNWNNSLKEYLEEKLPIDQFVQNLFQILHQQNQQNRFSLSISLKCQSIVEWSDSINKKIRSFDWFRSIWYFGLKRWFQSFKGLFINSTRFFRFVDQWEILVQKYWWSIGNRLITSACVFCCSFVLFWCCLTNHSNPRFLLLIIFSICLVFSWSKCQRTVEWIIFSKFFVLYRTHQLSYVWELDVMT